MSWYYIVLIIFLVLLLLYTFAVMPRMTKQKETADLCKGYFAHRGLHDNKSHAPENSMLSFKKAMEAGYGVELDVQLTKDGSVVVFHDDKLERVCRQAGKVKHYTYEQLKVFKLLDSEEGIPLFTDVLKLVDGKIPLIVEIKIHENVKKVCKRVNEVLADYKGDYVIESFHPFAVAWYKKNRPDVIRGQLSTNINKDHGTYAPGFFMLRHLLFNFVSRPDFIAYCYKYSKEVSLNVCKRMFGAIPVTWTIKSQEDLDVSKSAFDAYIFEGFIPEE